MVRTTKKQPSPEELKRERQEKAWEAADDKWDDNRRRSGRAYRSPTGGLSLARRAEREALVKDRALRADPAALTKAMRFHLDKRASAQLTLLAGLAKGVRQTIRCVPPVLTTGSRYPKAHGRSGKPRKATHPVIAVPVDLRELR